MKVKILLLLVVLITSALTHSTKPDVCAPLKSEKGKCICYATNKPVCGKSGKTHANECLAKCQGDTIKHEGPCYKQCQKKVTKHKKCETKKYGGFGTRKWCCENATVCWGKDCTNTKVSCQWEGHVFIKYKQSKCEWEKKDKNTKQRKCCTWDHVCEGDQCYDTMKKCTLGRKIVKKQFNKCEKKGYGHGVRTRCCSGTELCITNKKKTKCYKKNTKCKFTGVIESTKEKEICDWKQATSTELRKVRQCTNVDEKYDLVIDFLTDKELRDRALQRCNHTNQYVFYSCVFDESKGVLRVKQEYDEIAKWLNEKTNQKRCYSSGDPHILTFSGKGYDVYNIEQAGRTVYHKGDVKVTTDVKFNKKWGTRGVNVAAYLEFKGEKFAAHVPVNGKENCGGSDKLKPTVSGTKNKKYSFKVGEVSVDFEVFVDGYINVFVTAPKLLTQDCTGDCCAHPEKVVTQHKGVTFLYGNPYAVEFQKTCDRKADAVKICTAKSKKFEDVAKCLKENSKNFSEKVVRETVKEPVIQCTNVKKVYDDVVDFFTAEELKERALRRCKHDDKFVYFSCVYDESRGMLRVKEEYEKVAKFVNEQVKGDKKCFSTGDPHIDTFEKKGTNVYNVEQNKRVLYKHANLEVSCDIKFDKRWGTRGINSAVYVKEGSKSWSVSIPKGGKWNQCGGTGGLVVRRNEQSKLDNYKLTIGKTIVEVRVHMEGYIDVFITAPGVDTTKCQGDCCGDPKAHPIVDKNITWKYGDPFQVAFTSVCERKAQAVKECTGGKDVFNNNVKACLVELSKNQSPKRLRDVVKEKTVVVYNEKKVEKVVKKEKGKRYQCCRNKYKCYNKECKVVSKKCQWKSETVYKKRHYKCEKKKFGPNGLRNRCCIWISKCTHKGCKISYKKCFWKGCATYTWNKYKCVWKRQNKLVKREECCHYKKQCTGSKCKVFDKQCKWARTKTTKFNKHCKTKKYGRFGTRQWCCKEKKHCLNDKCTVTNDCKWVGDVKIVRKHNECKVTEFKDNRKCNYCCSWVHTCEKGECKDTEKKCECKGAVTKWYFKEKCALKKISETTQQNECCTWRDVCVGDKCSKKDYKCHFVGFPIVVTKHKKCEMKLKSDGKSRQLYCCHHVKHCQGEKCDYKAKGCVWKGYIYKKEKVVKCERKEFKVKGNTRKWCCEYIKSCKGTFCKNVDKHCEWRGLVRTTKIKKSTIWKKYKKDGKRKWECKWIEVCEGVKCNDSKKKCDWKGYAIYTHKRESTEWKWKSKNVKQKYYCVWWTKCINNHCKTTQEKQCRYVGSVISIKQHKQCKFVVVGKNAKRKKCTFWTNVCTDDKCVVKKKYSKWFGKVITVKSKLICKWKQEKGKQHKYCCRYILKCVGETCKNLFAPNCYFSHSVTTTKKQECKWMFVKPPTPKSYVKQKKCKYYTEVCHSKDGCHQTNVSFKWVGLVIKKRHYVECKVQFFGTNHKRKFCCNKTELCHGAKCHVHDHKCEWKGQAWKVSAAYEVYRWITTCKDKPFGKGTDIRLECCRTYQKCVQHKDHFKCETVKQGNCWWSGGARGDVHILRNGEWKTLNIVGTFKYLIDTTKNIGLYTQFTKTGDGSSTTAFALKAGTDVLTLSVRDGKLFGKLNGNVLERFKHVKFNNDINGALLKDKTVIVNLESERLIAHVANDVIELNVEIKASDNADGLLVSEKEPSKQAVSWEEVEKLKLGFERRVDYANLPDVQSHNGIDVEKCCQGLEDQKYKDCVSDSRRTGKCFADQYKESAKIDLSQLQKHPDGSA